MSILNFLNEVKEKNSFSLLALIDPDKKNDSRLRDILHRINSSNFNAILVGGSYIEDDLFEKRIKYIKYFFIFITYLLLFHNLTSYNTMNIVIF